MRIKKQIFEKGVNLCNLSKENLETKNCWRKSNGNFLAPVEKYFCEERKKIVLSSRMKFAEFSRLSFPPFYRFRFQLFEK